MRERVRRADDPSRAPARALDSGPDEDYPRPMFPANLPEVFGAAACRHGRELRMGAVSTADDPRPERAQ